MSRPPLRLIDGLRADADEQRMEAAVIRDEARAHVARMRLVLQRSFWTTSEFQPVHKRLLNEVDTFARKLADAEPELAA